MSWAIYANVAAPDSCLRLGAKVVLCLATGGAPDRAKWRGISRGGRWVTKWAAHKRLTNPRVRWSRPGGEALAFTDRKDAERQLERLEGWA